MADPPHGEAVPVVRRRGVRDALRVGINPIGTLENTATEYDRKTGIKCESDNRM
jgi:hypothetical protein